MKNYLKNIILLLALLLPTIAVAYDFEVDGIYYNKNSDGTSVSVTYETTSYNSYSGDVTIPETITFNGITYEVTGIGNEAFSECSCLRSIHIPESITSIYQSFINCTALESITIPKNVTSVFNAFAGCSSLKELIWNATNCISGPIIDHDPKVTYNIEHVVIGDNVEVLPSSFVRNTKISAINIPNTVRVIGSGAFSNCADLVSVKMPESITDINESTFYNCSSLVDIEIPNSVTNIKKNSFYGCSSLTCITIPNSVTTIGDYAFYGCSGLLDIVIPSSVTSFGKYVFANCTGLTSFTIPDTFTSYNRAFVGCTSLKSLTIPNSFTTIERGEFYYCTGLESIYIPNSVSSIQSGAFEYCTSLAEIIIPDSVVTIGDYYTGYDGTFTGAFSGCIGLKRVTIGKSLSGTHSGAFSGCSGITELIWNTKNSCSFSNMPKSEIKQVFIGDEVEELPSSFVEGSKIESIMIPNSVSKIGKSAFKDCLNLTNATISNSITSLPESMFSNCRKLKTITIPYSVTSIGNDAFYYCEDLTDVICLAKTPPIMGNYNSCYPAYQMATLHVPERSVEVYKATDWWNCFLIIQGDATENGTSDDSDYMKCDTNSDGEVNIADVNRVIDAILNH